MLVLVHLRDPPVCRIPVIVKLVAGLGFLDVHIPCCAAGHGGHDGPLGLGDHGFSLGPDGMERAFVFPHPRNSFWIANGLFRSDFVHVRRQPHQHVLCITQRVHPRSSRIVTPDHWDHDLVPLLLRYFVAQSLLDVVRLVDPQLLQNLVDSLLIAQFGHKRRGGIGHNLVHDVLTVLGLPKEDNLHLITVEEVCNIEPPFSQLRSHLGLHCLLHNVSQILGEMQRHSQWILVRQSPLQVVAVHQIVDINLVVDVVCFQQGLEPLLASLGHGLHDLVKHSLRGTLLPVDHCQELVTRQDFREIDAEPLGRRLVARRQGPLKACGGLLLD
mmetsp:Transcript_19983/g.42920  ORF Transcript_19983/g.42920 Transcript_19983/m.42920 type:complete len:328 (-) Transcript_19983:471-1454(-)